tara:strand:+ start:305 stop:826 length:522 start_codon:yes stop_codon:yes gene_type:complete
MVIYTILYKGLKKKVPYIVIQMEHRIQSKVKYIYKMSWFDTKRHLISDTDMYFAEEEHTRWGQNWIKGCNGSDICKIFVIQVTICSDEYRMAVKNSANRNNKSNNEDNSCAIKIFKSKNKKIKNLIWIFKKGDDKFLYQEGVNDNTEMKNTYLTNEELEIKLKTIENEYEIYK